MAWTRADIPDLSGRIAVVTGANGGLGLETARALAGAGAHVVMAARDQDKAANAQADIKNTESNPSLAIVPMDLGSLASVARAADAILSAHDRIDILVNNAGVMATPERATEDGFELQFGVNHLGHFALTSKLLPALLKAEAARVVSVTSTAHHMGRAVNPANPHLRGNYGAWKAYGQSKLANFHFGIGLQRRFEGAGTDAKSFIAHPGLSDTDLQAASVRNTDGGASQKFFHVLAGRTGMTPAQGAMPQIRAATDPTARGGEFFAPRYVNNGPAVKRPILRRVGLGRAIQTLWDVSEKETGVRLDVAAAARG
jgi:NAD(P)-dependent dehydrogenase (short-subunit alcohol dehydrogenase family)